MKTCLASQYADHAKQPLKPFLKADSSKFLPINTSLFILFSSGPHGFPGQPSKVECTPAQNQSNIKKRKILELLTNR